MEMVEVVLDLGRPPYARLPQGDVRLSEEPVSQADLEAAVALVGPLALLHFTFTDTSAILIEKSSFYAVLFPHPAKMHVRGSAASNAPVWRRRLDRWYPHIWLASHFLSNSFVG